MRAEDVGEIDLGPDRVSLRELDLVMPTYGVGEPDRNPMFLERRVYQGSSGRVYPLPVVDSVEDERRDRSWKVLVLENRWVQLWIMPELGGRIQRALDKTDHYDYVYYNRVIKPALVGLAGPWISGGIEFNWPQHHRPSTFLPLEYELVEPGDGSASVLLAETDRMNGTRMSAALTLRPESSRLEVEVELGNGTALPQSFLWWANPAVPAGDDAQSVFPPDVRAVMDHGRRDVSSFPIARGEYYKVDYSRGVDISRYRNIPVPTSYMAWRSSFDFLGHYDHGRRAGMLHVADHHASPGKKQWTWGTGGFGAAWERNLTDEDGPYVELMAGVFTDNQPDFTWLAPYETKSFVQYFMPLRGIGVARNANRDWALSIEVEGRTARIGAAAFAVFRDLRLVLSAGGAELLSRTCSLDPAGPLVDEAPLPEGVEPRSLRLALSDGSGRRLEAAPPEAYEPAAPEPLPEPARPVAAPGDIPSVDGLYWAGQHLEQYRHATRDPEPYYREALRRDPEDYRSNVAMGALLIRRGEFLGAEPPLRRAVSTATRYNPNPADGAAHFYLGTALRYQGRRDEAFELFWKASWSGAWRSAACLELGRIAASRGDRREALGFAETCLLGNARNMKARHLEAATLRSVGSPDRRRESLDAALELDPLDPGACAERCFLEIGGPSMLEPSAEGGAARRLLLELGSESRNVRELCADYLAMGDWAAAEALASWGLGRTVRAEASGTPDPLLRYYLAYARSRGRSLAPSERASDLALAAAQSPDWVFPNRLEDLVVLEDAAAGNPRDAVARYALGNLLYDRGRRSEAIARWREAEAIDPSSARVKRNLALASHNALRDGAAALALLSEAAALAPGDARIAFELDQLRKRTGAPPEERWKALEGARSLWSGRDDFRVEAAELLNTLGRFDEALAALRERRFHPWEGGEGKATRQYEAALVGIGRRELSAGRPAEALRRFDEALASPDFLGEGRLPGARDRRVRYWRAEALEALGRRDEAAAEREGASSGELEPRGMMYYNDQPPEMIYYQGLCLLGLGRRDEARRRFETLATWGRTHVDDRLEIDYFAVSLPDFLVFEEDLDKRNRLHCLYMIALGETGLRRLGEGGEADAEDAIAAMLSLDPNHQGARELGFAGSLP